MTDRASAPKQGDEGAPEAWLAFEPAVIEGLTHIRKGDELIVLTWLHLARRTCLAYIRATTRRDHFTASSAPGQRIVRTRSASIE